MTNLAGPLVQENRPKSVSTVSYFRPYQSALRFGSLFISYDANADPPVFDLIYDRFSQKSSKIYSKHLCFRLKWVRMVWIIPDILKDQVKLRKKVFHIII